MCLPSFLYTCITLLWRYLFLPVEKRSQWTLLPAAPHLGVRTSCQGLRSKRSSRQDSLMLTDNERVKCNGNIIMDLLSSALSSRHRRPLEHSICLLMMSSQLIHLPLGERDERFCIHFPGYLLFTNILMHFDPSLMVFTLPLSLA